MYSTFSELSLLNQNQYDAWTVINNNFLKLDQILKANVLSRSLTTPPNVVNNGDKYIVAQGGQNEFSGQDNKIAVFYTNSGWRFISPYVGMQVYVLDESYFYVFLSSGLWSKFSLEQSDFTGDYKISAQTSDHGRWLLCDGRAVSTSMYPDLSALIIGKFGTASNPENFILPDGRGRVPGISGIGSGLSNRHTGDYVGSEVHTLSINEIPGHTHGAPNSSFATIVSSGGNWSMPSGTFATYSGSTTITGGGEAHNNMQPTIFCGNLFIHH